MPVKPIPEGYHSVTPYLIVEGASKLMEFLKEAFDAKETFRMNNSDGTVAHAEVRIGDSVVMMGEAGGEHIPMACAIHLYVNDMDTTYVRALEAGATSLREPRNEFYGDRSSGVKDQWGNRWWIVTHVEDVSSEEIERRAAAQRG
ncbi:MAG: VOC family protein [bacterium]